MQFCKGFRDFGYRVEVEGIQRCLVVRKQMVVYHSARVRRTLCLWGFWGSIVWRVFYHRLGLDSHRLRCHVDGWRRPVDAGD